MQKLPVAIDLPGGCRVSHTGHGQPTKPEDFVEVQVWARDFVFPDDGRFRIFGHTQEEGVVLTDHWAKIDTGAAYTHQGFGTLTAFCWPTKQIVQQRYDETPL